MSMERAVTLRPTGHPINQTVTVMKAFGRVSRTNRIAKGTIDAATVAINPNQYV